METIRGRSFRRINRFIWWIFCNDYSYANLDIDCVDLTSADVNTLLNTWTGNTGNSDSPAGICVEPK